MPEIPFVRGDFLVIFRTFSVPIFSSATSSGFTRTPVSGESTTVLTQGKSLVTRGIPNAFASAWAIPNASRAFIDGNTNASIDA